MFDSPVSSRQNDTIELHAVENIMRNLLSRLESSKLYSFKPGHEVHESLCPALRNYRDVCLDLWWTFTNSRPCSGNYGYICGVDESSPNIGVASMATNRKKVPSDQKKFYEKTGFYINSGAYVQRPEVIESFYYAHRVTGKEIACLHHTTIMLILMELANTSLVSRQCLECISRNQRYLPH